MKKSARRFFAILSTVLVLASYLPTTVHATWGMYSGRTTIYVNDQIFELHGYSGDVTRHAFFRLRDIAYIMRGTPVEFDIRESPDNRWGYWIVTGATYIPIGMELQPTLERRQALFGSYGFVASGSQGFGINPFQHTCIRHDKFPVG